MLVILWRYEVRERDAFRRFYGPEGEWARLFGRADGFLGVELLEGRDGCFVTIDRWRSERDFEAFFAAHRDAYEALDRAAEALTISEERIGRFETVR